MVKRNIVKISRNFSFVEMTLNLPAIKILKDSSKNTMIDSKIFIDVTYCYNTILENSCKNLSFV